MAEESDASSQHEEKNKPFMDELNIPEPGIINLEMIEAAYLLEGQHGENRRLHQLEPIVLERIRTMRLEFKNILRIDHLWILPNLTKLCLNCNKIEVIEHIGMLTALKELNLSFNYITKIENLHTLINLEVLSLFSNRITKIENLEALDKLVILSIGNNLIEKFDGIERLRFVNSLRVLNLEGNPIAKLPEFPLSQYVTAMLPQLNYYEYVYIKDEMREAAQKRFYRELREIEDKQEREIKGRETQARELAEAERLASSFVEHLDGQQLYESMWRDDEHGKVLLLVGAQAQELVEEYDKDVHELTQQLYKLGLERFGEREQEIKKFMNSLQAGQKEAQSVGQQQIEDFLQLRDKTFDEACILAESTSNPAMDTLHAKFEDALNDLWHSLMTQELHLHEAVEESTLSFQHGLSALMLSFVEQAQSLFLQLRDVCLHFSDNLCELVSRFIANKLTLRDLDSVPQELRICIDDREAVVKLVADMRSTHISRIEQREDRMSVRSKEFIEHLIEKLSKEETERHRAKILEINAFMEMMTEAMANLTQQLDIDECESPIN
ncbi:dynein regulatory complex subunit 3 [Drosophila busckii]|uniref:dynein regulatory complex subunit 3 n=1 Tax=Drosophila busckii TaxID=30019 RepID=UPI00143339DD|nr:dynein regulatory complex subunit 3 [Drosophila busckii]